MDNPEQQFKALEKSLRKEIRDELRTATDELKRHNEKYHLKQPEDSQPPPPNVSIDEPGKSEIGGTEGKSGKHNSQETRHFWIQQSIQIVLTLATIGAFIAAAIYAGVANSTLDAVRESNRISRESLIAVQRPFVMYDGINLDTARKSAATQELLWAFSASLENAGATPATNKIQYFSASNELTDLPSEDQFMGNAKDWGRGGEFGPKSKKGLGPIIKDSRFVLGNFRLMDIGKPDFMRFFNSERIFFWGWVIYRDSFPNTPVRLIEFCQEVKGVAATSHLEAHVNPILPSVRPVLNLADCNKHNCSDEYCPDYAEITKKVLSDTVAPDVFGIDKLRP